jgi:hypothetical protein
LPFDCGIRSKTRMMTNTGISYAFRFGGRLFYGPLMNCNFGECFSRNPRLGCGSASSPLIAAAPWPDLHTISLSPRYKISHVSTGRGSKTLVRPYPCHPHRVQGLEFWSILCMCHNSRIRCRLVRQIWSSHMTGRMCRI